MHSNRARPPFGEPGRCRASYWGAPEQIAAEHQHQSLPRPVRRLWLSSPSVDADPTARCRGCRARGRGGRVDLVPKGAHGGAAGGDAQVAPAQFTQHLGVEPEQKGVHKDRVALQADTASSTGRSRRAAASPAPVAQKGPDGVIQAHADLYRRQRLVGVQAVDASQHPPYDQGVAPRRIDAA